MDIKFNPTPCGFCNGTGIEPGETNCVWCNNTGIDWAGKPGDVPVVEAMPRNLLREALEHIQKTAGQSRTQTRRLRWIAKRAELALAGRPYVAAEHELPVVADQEYNKLRVQAKRLRIERRDMHEHGVLLEGLLLQTNELLYAIQGDPGSVPSSSIDAMRGRVFQALKREDRTNTSGNAHCPHDGICHTKDETCAEAQLRISLIKPETGYDFGSNELSIYTYRSKPKTGGFDNSPDDGIAILHRPSGIEARCHDHRSNHANSAAAMAELRKLIQADDDRALQLRDDQERSAYFDAVEGEGNDADN